MIAARGARHRHIHSAGLIEYRLAPIESVGDDDIDALATALRRLIGDRALRQHLAEAAFAAADRLPTWESSAEIIAATIEAIT